MKTNAIAEIRHLVSEALASDNIDKMTQAIIRATELAEEEAGERLSTKTDIETIRTNIESVRTAVAESKVDMIKWMVGTALVSLGLLASAIYFATTTIISHLRP